MGFESGVATWYFLRLPALWLWLDACALVWVHASWRADDHPFRFVRIAVVDSRAMRDGTRLCRRGTQVARTLR